MENKAKASRLIVEIRQLLADPHDTSRQSVVEISKRLTRTLEAPDDTAVQLSYMPLQTLCAKLAIDLGLFKFIARRGRPVTADELAKESGGEQLLIVRILRVLSLLEFVEETNEQTWTATTITHSMIKPAVEGSHNHLWDMTVGTAAKMPEYMKQFGYKCSTDIHGGPLQYALNTSLTLFEFWSSKPDTLNDFNNMMAGVRQSRPSWIEWFPVDQELLNGYRQDTHLLVDVGGGWGHDIVAFQKTHAPDAKLALQDLPNVIANVQNLAPNIECSEYDFFAREQPIHGARAYFFHFILHDWPDDECIKILRNTAPAMTPGYSNILLNEFVLPDQGCSMSHALMDINMLAITSGLERTRRQWRDLIDRSGLRISKFQIPVDGGEAIIEIEQI